MADMRSHILIINYSSNEHMLANLTNRECDRFIPHRNHFKLHLPNSLSEGSCSQAEFNYDNLIKKRLFQSSQESSLFSLNRQYSDTSSQTSADSKLSSKLQPNVSSPVKILDVPKYKDDFYLNNIDWSENGPLGIALQNEVFLYTPENITQISRNTFGPLVSGLKICDQLMAIGSMNGMIQLYDIQTCSVVRTLLKHESRVAALMFMDGLLVSGSKDRSIVVHDLRQREHVIRQYRNHKGEVCTLKAKNKTEKIFASGSSDGSAIVWDLKYGFIDQLKGHKGAVKALDWCPWKSGILATGGGNDSQKEIKLWNTSNSKLILQQPIQSQISSIVWNEDLKMMISSHGYSENELKFWSLDSKEHGKCQLQCRMKFKAHSSRILNMLQSQDSNHLCTVGADESLKFWNLKEAEGNPFKGVQFIRTRQQNGVRL